MKVEYLVLIQADEKYCKSLSTLNYLIQSYDGIQIVHDEVVYENSKFKYDVKLGEPENTGHRFFHIQVVCTQESEVENFQDFLKLLRTILSKISGHPVETLYDEFGSERCFTAYPLIHNVENQMRKLITKFMLTNIGLGWSKENTPRVVTESIKSPNPKTTNFLHEVDFIQLSKFLFSNYASLDSKNVIEKIKQAESASDLDLDELKEFVPQSNWERYFATIVDCSSEFLENRWKKLYDLRNKVAHNRFITEQELGDIQRLCSEVGEKLKAAIDNLDKIHVSEEQIDEVAENVAINRDEIYAKFLNSWNSLIRLMYEVALFVADESDVSRLGKGGNWRGISNVLNKYDITSHGFKNKLKELSAFRSTLVHHTDVMFPDETVEEKQALLAELDDELVKLKQDFEQQQTTKAQLIDPKFSDQQKSDDGSLGRLTELPTDASRR